MMIQLLRCIFVVENKGEQTKVNTKKGLGKVIHRSADRRTPEPVHGKWAAAAEHGVDIDTNKCGMIWQ